MCFTNADSTPVNNNPIQSCPRTRREITNEVESLPAKRNFSQTTEIPSV